MASVCYLTLQVLRKLTGILPSCITKQVYYSRTRKRSQKSHGDSRWCIFGPLSSIDTKCQLGKDIHRGKNCNLQIVPVQVALSPLVADNHASITPSCEGQEVTISFKLCSLSAKPGPATGAACLTSPSRPLYKSVTLPRCRTASHRVSSFADIRTRKGSSPSSKALSHTSSPFEVGMSAMSVSQ